MSRMLRLLAVAAAATAGAAGSAGHVGFVQDGSLHLPGSAGTREDSGLTPKQLGAAVSRVLCLDAPALDLEGDLPAGDLFQRPHANLLLFMDGWSSDVAPEATPYISKALAGGVGGAGGYELRLPREEGWSSALHSSLDSCHWEPALVAGARAGSFPLCSSIDPVLFETEVCQQFSTIAPKISTSKLSRAAADAGLNARYDAVTDAWLVPVDEQEVSLPLSEPAADAVLQEVAALLALPRQVEERLAGGGAAAQLLAVAYSSSLRGIAVRYGFDSPEAAAAAALLDGAAAAVGGRLVAGGRRLSVQVVAGRQLADVVPLWHHAHRRLADANDSSNSTTYTQAQINQYQINLWTGVGLVLAVGAAIAALVGMEFGRDSLLYAKFQADVSGLKVD